MRAVPAPRLFPAGGALVRRGATRAGNRQGMARERAMRAAAARKKPRKKRKTARIDALIRQQARERAGTSPSTSTIAPSSFALTGKRLPAQVKTVQEVRRNRAAVGSLRHPKGAPEWRVCRPVALQSCGCRCDQWRHALQNDKRAPHCAA